MYKQVYFHPVRKAYDIHLRDFLRDWLTGGRFPLNLSEHLNLDDHRVRVAIADVVEGDKSFDAALRLSRRKHFRAVRIRNAVSEVERINSEKIHDRIVSELESHLGAEHVRHWFKKSANLVEFPVLGRDGASVTWASEISPVIGSLPPFYLSFIYVEPTHRAAGKQWIKENEQRIVDEINEENPIVR
jgi:HD superfamily phosphohydrolase